jgi:NAD(P)-dependent dehydrogenase (short-subunit alcohol dehydrogenase family)
MNAKNGSSVRDKVVLITGALSGIGRGAALTFAREGAKVVISERRAEAGQSLVKELRELGAEADFVLTDVRHEDDVRQLIDHAVSRFGCLNVAINNAGTTEGSGPITAQIDPAISEALLGGKLD